MARLGRPSPTRARTSASRSVTPSSAKAAATPVDRRVTGAPARRSSDRHAEAIGAAGNSSKNTAAPDSHRTGSPHPSRSAASATRRRPR